MSAPRLVEDFFRHECGRLVATLVGRVGVRHLDLVEDAAQAALAQALDSWPRAGVPRNPSAWLYRVAHNTLLSVLRQRTARRRLLERHAMPDLENAPDTPCADDDDMHDDLLRMLFVCCDARLPLPSQLVLALKTLCGFDVREIASRLFLSEANVYKRLGRARAQLRKAGRLDVDLSTAQVISRLPAVLTVLYLLFTEGYLSSRADSAIRRELCAEAIRLVTLLATHPVGRDPETFALLALMHFHTARLTSRQDADGGLLLLEEQDRANWDQREIQEGMVWLARSSHGDVFSRYHAEAAIAAEHCLAPTFAATRWDRVAECYAMLERLTASPIHRLNRAVAIAEWKGSDAGLTVLEGFAPPTWLVESYMWAAVLADLHRRRGDMETASGFLSAARALAPNKATSALLDRRAQFTCSSKRGSTEGVPVHDPLSARSPEHLLNDATRRARGVRR